MPINTSLFTAQSGDYSVITQAITAEDALNFTAIYEALNDHAIACNSSLMEYVEKGIQVNLSDLNIPQASIARLKAVGIIATSDNIHIGLTLLGYGFYQFIQV